jgi:fructose-1,6-bisphosphatase-3
VVDYLRQQPNVSIIWGNHDASWLGAGLGHEALICNVLRISLRYRRLAQIDQGYSIPLTPLEYLANTVYADDPATHFMPKERGMRPMALVARMQKAAAVMQFKLEGQMIERNPQWQMGHRRLLHRINSSTIASTNSFRRSVVGSCSISEISSLYSAGKTSIARFKL